MVTELVNGDLVRFKDKKEPTYKIVYTPNKNKRCRLEIIGEKGRFASGTYTIVRINNFGVIIPQRISNWKAEF